MLRENLKPKCEHIATKKTKNDMLTVMRNEKVFVVVVVKYYMIDALFTATKAIGKLQLIPTRGESNFCAIMEKCI